MCASEYTWFVWFSSVFWFSIARVLLASGSGDVGHARPVVAVETHGT